MFMKIEVDNRGKGNCAFYSFSIALIDIIKHEQHRNNESPTLARWIEFIPEIENQRDAILNFNFQRQNNELLDILQRSLREITYQQQYQQLDTGRFLADNEIKGLAIYTKFAELCWNYPRVSACNDLAKSTQIKQLVKKIKDKTNKKNVDEEEEILETFLIDVYGMDYKKFPRQLNEKSAILKAIQAVIIKKPLWWGTHDNLNRLAQAFDVRLEYYINGVLPYEAQQEPRPVVRVNNIKNGHWTTFIITSNLVPNSSNQNYQRFFRDSFLTKNEIKKIYLTYTKGFHSWFGRTHQAKAEEIVNLCDNIDSTVEDIIADLRNYLINPAFPFNEDSSFKKRANYILARNQFYNGALQQENTAEHFLIKNRIKNIYLTYTKGFHSWFGRTHLDKAKEIIDLCDNVECSVEQIMETISNYVDDTHFNENSSFRKRADYILTKINPINQVQEPLNPAPACLD